jgi:O-antigen/teichoic acid export membrane protein
LFIGLIISSLTFILSDYFAVYAVNRPDTSVFIRLASFTIMLNAISTTSTSVFVGMDKMEYGALVMDVQAVTKATLSILLVILGLGIMGPVIGYMIGALAGGLLGALLLHFKLYRSLDPQRKQ